MCRLRPQAIRRGDVGAGCVGGCGRGGTLRGARPAARSEPDEEEEQDPLHERDPTPSLALVVAVGSARASCEALSVRAGRYIVRRSCRTRQPSLKSPHVEPCETG